MEGNDTEVDKTLKIIGITPQEYDKSLDGKKKMKVVFQKWINAADSILEMIILRLPSPVKA